jgi:nicotinate-nucleotide adenylyltransferase
MRIGVFGGTFDPIHYGHLILAEQCREQARLDQIWFVLAARPPHKQEDVLSPFEQRAEMLALALAGNPAFRVEPIEEDRPGPSYTADTLTELQHRHPADEFFLLVGSDTLKDLPTWYHPQVVLRHASLLVMARPNNPLLPVEQLRSRLRLPDTMPLRLEVVETPLIDISSRDLRRRTAAGRSLRYFLPRAVECYIQEKHLYRKESGVRSQESGVRSQRTEDRRSITP